MPWYLYALGAALIWGVHYNLLGRALTTISPITAYWLPTTIMLLGLPFMWDTLKTDFKAVLSSDPITQLAVGTIMFTSFAASIFLYKSIQLHNPIHACLLEITYPIFVTTFALLMFNQNHFSMGTVIGGILIMVGAGIIIYTNG